MQRASVEVILNTGSRFVFSEERFIEELFNDPRVERIYRDIELEVLLIILKGDDREDLEVFTRTFDVVYLGAHLDTNSFGWIEEVERKQI